MFSNFYSSAVFFLIEKLNNRMSDYIDLRAFCWVSIRSHVLSFTRSLNNSRTKHCLSATYLIILHFSSPSAMILLWVSTSIQKSSRFNFSIGVTCVFSLRSSCNFYCMTPSFCIIALLNSAFFSALDRSNSSFMMSVNNFISETGLRCSVPILRILSSLSIETWDALLGYSSSSREMIKMLPSFPAA